MHEAEQELCKWAGIYGLSEGEARVRTRYFIDAYKEAGCKELLSTGSETIHFSQFNGEQHKLSEHVVLWLCCGSAPRLHGFLTGYFGERAQAIQERAWGESDLGTPYSIRGRNK